jgi:hypothetical protein
VVGGEGVGGELWMFEFVDGDNDTWVPMS